MDGAVCTTCRQVHIVGREYDHEHTWPAAPATQHRVIPVEWHRVAVEPMCAHRNPYHMGRDIDCELERGHKTNHRGHFIDGTGQKRDSIWSINSRDQREVLAEPAAQPANTDDRQADTIPERVILLSQGQFAIVDADDFELLSQWKWNAHKSETGTWYAVRSVGRGTVRMHRVIMANPSRHVDHINGNGLDNRKLNLRIANQSQNMMNRGLPANNTSGFKGVTWDKKYESWKSQIKVNQKLIHLGNFPTPEEASSAYENAARLHFGEFYKEAK